MNAEDVEGYGVMTIGLMTPGNTHTTIVIAWPVNCPV